MPSRPPHLSIDRVLGSGRLLVLTDRVQARRSLLDVTTAAIAGGATAILLREKDLPRPERADLAKTILAQLHEPAPKDRARARSLGARTGLLVASDGGLAVEVGAAGVHLAAAEPWPTDALFGADGRRLLVGRSCHGETELLAARDEGVDYAIVSPVFGSASKPGYGPALGLEGLARLCGTVPGLPVVALGGIGSGRVARCLSAGAAGVAVMGEVMRADDPAGTVSSLLGELASQR